MFLGNYHLKPLIFNVIATYKESATRSSVFDTSHYFKDALPKDNCSFIYRDRIFPLIDETKFKHLYSESEGRPNAPVKLMISLRKQKPAY